MKYSRYFVTLVCSAGTMFTMVSAAATANAQNASAPTYKVLAALNSSDGEGPIGNLAMDNSGNIYGVTAHGGSSQGEFCYNNQGCGTVFEASPSSSGSWNLTLIHTFIGDSENDGALPLSGLTLDGSGNLYGATPYGGSCPISTAGCGVVYEISPAAGGGWQAPKILYSFQGNADGISPQSPLIFDKAGNLYGTTYGGGTGYGGTVFELSPTLSGPWNKTTLYNFKYDTSDGNSPEGGVIFDAAGNLYGTTEVGGADTSGNCSSQGCGTVYELSPNGSGEWSETILLSFNSTDGNNPLGNFAMDSAGNLYGATLTGGPGNDVCGIYGCGVVYEMAKSESGGWSEKLLRDLPETVGGFYSGPALDPAGNLYATLYSGGPGKYGVAFRLAKSSTTPWPLAVLYSFNGEAVGGYPAAGPLFSKGSLFGTTSVGGNTSQCVQSFVSGCGVVYEIK
ncbi:MAG: choice-of-anchor tandem repeat GloVer-containing protein [Candidatus Sulfotelmatobacter sp.]